MASSNGSGIVLNAGSELTGAVVKGNAVAENVGSGITVEGSGVRVTQNRVTGNGTGIEIRSPGAGNRVDKNHVAANLDTGIVLRDGNGGNRVKQNLALGSPTDLVDEAAACDANLWRKNVFASSSQDCVE